MTNIVFNDIIYIDKRKLKADHCHPIEVFDSHSLGLSRRNPTHQGMRPPFG
jgi:hypothetical protein